MKGILRSAFDAVFGGTKEPKTTTFQMINGWSNFFVPMEDYNAFIRNNFSYHFLDPDQLAVLAGDIFKLPSAVTSPRTGSVIRLIIPRLVRNIKVLMSVVSSCTT